MGSTLRSDWNSYIITKEINKILVNEADTIFSNASENESPKLQYALTKAILATAGSFQFG